MKSKTGFFPFAFPSFSFVWTILRCELVNGGRKSYDNDITILYLNGFILLRRIQIVNPYIIHVWNILRDLLSINRFINSQNGGILFFVQRNHSQFVARINGFNNIFIFVCVCVCICVSQVWTIHTANRCHVNFLVFFDGIAILLHFSYPTRFHASPILCLLLLFCMFFLAVNRMLNICIGLREHVDWIEYFDVEHSSSSVARDTIEKFRIPSLALNVTAFFSHVVSHFIIQFNSTYWGEEKKRILENLFVIITQYIHIGQE